MCCFARVRVLLACGVAICWGLFPAALAAQAIPGDINGDGVVDAADVRLAEDHVTGEAPLSWEEVQAGDLDGTGSIELGDVIRLAKLAADGELTVVPDVTYEGWQRAEYLLGEAGLEMGRKLEVRSGVHVNTVVGQSPRGGALVRPGAAVDLYVSAGDSGGSYLEISPTEVDLGTGDTSAVFQVTCHGEPIPWTTGMWAVHKATPASGVGGGTVTLELDRLNLPFGELELAFAVVPVGGAGAVYAAVRMDQTVHPPPRLDFFTGRMPRSPGDAFSIDGGYFAAVGANNEVMVNGVVFPADSVAMGPPNLRFTMPGDIPPGMVEVRARRTQDATFGPSPWGSPVVTRLASPTVPVLERGPDGGALWLGPKWWTRTVGVGTEEVEVEPTDWILGGRNFSLLEGVNISLYDGEWALVPTSDDPFAMELVVGGEQFFVPAVRLSDDRVAVMVRRMHNRRQELLDLLGPGMKVEARLWASEPANGQVRRSGWVSLATAAERPPVGSVLDFGIYALSIVGDHSTDWDSDVVLQLAKGTTIVLDNTGYESQVLSAPGLWDGDLTFHHINSMGFKSHGVLLDTPGSYFLQNKTTGRTRTLEVLDGGAPSKWFPDGDYVRSNRAVWVRVEPDEPVSLWHNGAVLDVAADALPSEDGVENFVTFRYYNTTRNPSFEFFDPEVADDETQVWVSYYRSPAGGTDWLTEWEPESLRGNLAVEMPYSDGQALNGPPNIGILDTESGIYWEMPTVADAGNRRVRTVFPAFDYGRRDEGRTSSGLPPVPLYQMTRSVGIPYLRSERRTMTDVDNRFTVNFISDSGSSSYVPNEYAEGVLATAVAAWEELEERQWREPDGPTVIYLRRTLIGGYGSTTKAVFGRPTVTINIAECPIGSAAYYTTTAHEVGHVFQREYTTNVIAKWFDEATAEWVAFETVGAGNFLADNLNFALPFAKTLPLGFTFGYSTDEGYAASPWAIWLEKNYPGTVRRVFEELDGNPLAWENHRGTVADAAGESISQLYRDFARDFWIQSFQPVDTVSLTALANDTGRKVDLEMTDSGDVGFSDGRPILSSMRYNIEPTEACKAKFAGRVAVIRMEHNADAQLSGVTVYGDRAGRAQIPNSPEHVVTLETGGTVGHVLENPGKHRTYRFILVNGSVVNDFSPTVRMVYPTIESLSPSSGKKTGGYTVTVNGFGFGSEKGEITIAGTSVPISLWTDTRIHFNMPAVPDYVGSWDITVRTVEDAPTNARTFTFTD